MNKNEVAQLRCLRLGAEMEGVCEYENRPVFVPGILPGEEANVRLVQVKDRYAFGRVEELLKTAPERVAPRCPVYDRCGGCSCQHMTYETTLEWKRRQVADCLTRIGGLDIGEEEIPPVLGAERPYRSRNKTSLPVGGTADAPALGFYQRRSHRVVPISDCAVAMEGVEGLIAAVDEWMRRAAVRPYDELTHHGDLRHVIARATRNGQVMALLVSRTPRLPAVDLLIELLKKKVPGFCALHQSVNPSPGNVILGKTSRRLYGEEILVETLLGLSFEISPLSFFQVNPAQTERLYRAALDFANVRQGDLCVDAYAGAGTIALCMAKNAGRVIGLEVVAQAVESAKRNAQRNGMTNAEFYVGTVEELLPKMVEDGLRPDVIVLDPPRKGAEPEVLAAVVKASPRRVVYVSCHVPTQARDLAALAQAGYRFVGCQPVDMFCYAGGVENVACMEKAQDKADG